MDSDSTADVRLSQGTNDSMAEPLGLESKTVRVVSYDDRWPALFEGEAKRIADAVAATGLPELALEHVGSTAVPGLAAKPVLDIAAGYSAGIAAQSPPELATPSNEDSASPSTCSLFPSPSPSSSP